MGIAFVIRVKCTFHFAHLNGAVRRLFLAVYRNYKWRQLKNQEHCPWFSDLNLPYSNKPFNSRQFLQNVVFQSSQHL